MKKTILVEPTNGGGGGEDNDDEEGDDEEADQPKFISVEVAHLMQHYKIPPPNNYSNAFMIKGGITDPPPRLQHERILFDFSRTYDDKRPLSVCSLPVFQKESKFKSVRIIAIGLSSWSLSGGAAVGLNITGIPSTNVRVGQNTDKTLIALLPGASDINCNTLLFTANKTKIMNFTFSNWNVKRMLDNKEKSEFNGRSTYYLPIDVDPINHEPICPLGFFKAELIRMRGLTLSTEQRIISGVTTVAVQVDQFEYDKLCEEFTDAVSDNRIIVETKKCMIEVIPSNTEGFHCYVIIDVYYDTSI